MNRICGIVMAFVMICGFVNAMDKNDVVTLCKVGIDKEAIVIAIDKSGSKFDLSAKDVIELKNLGVDDSIIKAMVSTKIKKEEVKEEVVVAAPAPKTVVVEQPAPTVVVQQPAPTVVVQQPQPTVIVQEPTTVVYETSPVYVTRYYTPAPKPSMFSFDFDFFGSSHRGPPHRGPERHDRDHH